uniref:ATP synthase F0 subunit 8 n=1 Tax=Phyllomimus sinicus TaxID=948398 RepID=A0A7L9QDS4_9ORTH|nr:ATP synthase F0 subunit 8 [Phyllomimus sinicus]
MPQMSPMNWPVILLTCSNMLLLFIVMNYNNKNYTPPKINIIPLPTFSIMVANWKW